MPVDDPDELFNSRAAGDSVRIRGFHKATVPRPRHRVASPACRSLFPFPFPFPFPFAFSLFPFPFSDRPPLSAVLTRMTGRTRVGKAFAISAFVHTVALVLGALIALRVTDPGETTPRLAQATAHITWIAGPSPSLSGDGGSGSGDHAVTRARPMQKPGVEAVALPTRSSSARVDKPSTPEPLDIPALPTSAGIQQSLGEITTLTSVTDSSGPGSGGRFGSGAGESNGPGDGNFGTGPGANGGPGAGGYRPGNGVTPPRLLREVKPGYTGEAMRARIQGVVRLQAIVLPDGSVGNMKIVRSLDHLFGLDDEALKSVGQWRFQPGTLAGRAVPVLIEVELAFTLR